MAPVGSLWVIDDDQGRYTRLRAGQTVPRDQVRPAMPWNTWGWQPLASWDVTDRWLRIEPAGAPAFRILVTTNHLSGGGGLTVFVAARNRFRPRLDAS